MAVIRQRFEVDQVGCSSCAKRVRHALSALTTVDQIVVDEKADRATIVVSGQRELREEAVNEALARASLGSGHEYRVRAGSWRDAV